MAGNKFATMLQKNTHRLIAILVYALLEWILILLLLLNSFFTYLITKFANYFGLKPPCPWCSRVDHVLETSSSYRDIVCDAHAAEISKLGYCTNHGRLAESQNMCLDCLVSRPNHNHDQSVGITTRIAFVSWVGKDMIGNGDRVLRCSCCNECLSSDLYPPPFSLFNPSWSALKCTNKGSLIIESVNDHDDHKGITCRELSKLDRLAYYGDGNEMEKRSSGEEHHYDEGTADEHQTLSDFGSFGLKDAGEEDCSRSESNLQFDEKEANEDQKAESPNTNSTEQSSFGIEFYHQSMDESMIHNGCGQDDLVDIICSHLERNPTCEFDRLVPVEVIDSSTVTDHASCISEECQGKQDHPVITSDSALQNGTEADTVVADNKTPDDETKDGPVYEACNQDVYLLEAQTLSTDSNINAAAVIGETDGLPAQEEENRDFTLLVDQTKSSPLTEPSIKTNEPQAQASTPFLCLEEDHSSTNPSIDVSISDVPELGPNCRETRIVEGKMVSENTKEDATNHNLSMHTVSKSTDVEEEKFPETPNSVDSVHYLHKKLLLFEKRESGTDDSMDGSVVSEMDGSDPVLTVERMKKALKAERKALSALYAELEEERSASAIATNQTMAMINRLQEEKAAMQMEALQYQRMMEEQAEYDQEALQLLNELMLKREKEKQELEKELEVYRKKVLEYEAEEKMRMIMRVKEGTIRSRSSSATCSNPEDIDELSIDLNREAKDEEGTIRGNQERNNDDTPDEDINLEELALDCMRQMSALEDPLAEFEEERLSILDQLKVLEEKLLSLGDKEFNEDAHIVEHSSNYSPDECCEFSTPEENGVSSKDRQCPDRKSMGSMAKSLLPLLDAAENDVDGGLVTFEENADLEFVEIENSLMLDDRKLAIEEEVDHVYERLQALEADREFLKHCVSSMKKGDKGVNLLQEILQHLRDLRAVELRVKDMSDDPQE